MKPLPADQRWVLGITAQRARALLGMTQVEAAKAFKWSVRRQAVIERGGDPEMSCEDYALLLVRLVDLHKRKRR